MVAKTVITNAGLAAAAAAGLGSPEVKVEKVRFGSALIDPNATMTDVTDFVYEAPSSAIRYSIRDDNTVLYRIILDEEVGDFTIGNYGLVLEDGTVFSITSMAATTSKIKNNSPTIGNRKVWTLPLTLSGLATISDLSVLLVEELSIPEVAAQGSLPGAGVAPFNLYLVRQNTLFANRATLAAPVSGTWRYFPEDLGAGALTETNGLTFAGLFDAGVASGRPCYFDTVSDTFKLSNITTNKPRGIRGSGDVFHGPGSIYTHGSAIYTAGSVYYAQADGTLSTTVTTCEIGVALSTTKLLITAGLVQGEPWGGGGGYSPAGRVKTMFLTGPAFWPRQEAGKGPAQSFIIPTTDGPPSVYYYVFPKTGVQRSLELMIPIVKGLNRGVNAQLLLWWFRPASASVANAVKWSARHARIAEGIAITTPATAAVEIVDSAPSSGVYYYTGAIALDFSSYITNEEIAQITISRVNSDVADTLQSDAYLMGAFLRYTELLDTDA